MFFIYVLGFMFVFIGIVTVIMAFIFSIETGVIRTLKDFEFNIKPYLQEVGMFSKDLSYVVFMQKVVIPKRAARARDKEILEVQMNIIEKASKGKARFGIDRNTLISLYGTEWIEELNKILKPIGYYIDHESSYTHTIYVRREV